MLMVRIYLTEAEHGKKHTLINEIMAILHDRHQVHGVTVFRGIAGFGAKGTVHSADLLRLSANLPLVVEFFDEERIVEAVLAALSNLVPAEHIVSWPIQGHSE
jgi:PII-like signaling protein